MPLIEPDYDVFPESRPASKAWMVIFTDLVSLMLTFFVLLFSMSSVQIDQWDEMTDALSQTLNPSSEKTVTAVTAEYNIATMFRRRAVNLDYLGAVLEDTVTKDPVLSRSRLMRLEDRLVVALPGDLLFAPGRAELSERARQALFVLGGVLRNVGNQIGVNGHTDPTPPAGGGYQSNWELSMGRAAVVANSLRNSGYSEDIIAYGYADSRFGDLPDLPNEERMSLARRVDIIVFPTVGG
ncbi:MAG: flagellar motor protein MotB [Rhodospirillales bacterium]|nr:flagellar motor protein MotB [Rhodospirillales bacterium]